MRILQSVGKGSSVEDFCLCKDLKRWDHFQVRSRMGDLWASYQEHEAKASGHQMAKQWPPRSHSSLTRTAWLSMSVPRQGSAKSVPGYLSLPVWQRKRLPMRANLFCKIAAMCIHQELCSIWKWLYRNTSLKGTFKSSSIIFFPLAAPVSKIHKQWILCF